MPQPHPLGDMSRTRSPHHRILERLLQRPVDVVAHILDGRVAAADQSLGEIGFLALPIRSLALWLAGDNQCMAWIDEPLCVDSDQTEFLPDAINDVFNAQIQLTTHNSGVWLAG